MSKRFNSFDEYWQRHVVFFGGSQKRMLNLTGAGIAIYFIAFFLTTFSLFALVLAIIVLYAMPWIGFVMAASKGKPPFLEFPLWFAMAEIRMFLLWCAGRLEDEVDIQKGGASDSGKQDAGSMNPRPDTDGDNLSDRDE